MQNNEFTHEEMDILREVMQHAINELEIEIGRTDALDFKGGLKRRRAIMERIFAKLSPLPVSA